MDQEPEQPAPGWHVEKTRLFGHRVYLHTHPRAPGRLWVVLRIGNIPLGVPFDAQGAWGMIEVDLSQDGASE